VRSILVVALMLGISGMHSDSSSLASVQAQTNQQPLTHVYREVDGRSLNVYVFRPAGQQAGKQSSAILLFHGGGWNAGSAEWTFDAARRFAALGIVAISVEYRLSKGKITPIEALDDTCTAFRWARKHAADLSIDPNRVAGYGVSAGGQLVAAAATIGCPSNGALHVSSRPDALLLWSPAVDVTADAHFRRLLQGRASAKDYSPVEHVGRSTPPTSIVHGAKDSLTPLSGVKRFCDQMIQATSACELNVYEGVGHLLTRNLANQESDFDVDPKARIDGMARHQRFLREKGFIPVR